MTRYEAEATHGYGSGRATRPDWSQILIPIVAAILVIALGLALVLVTKEPASVPGETVSVPGETTLIVPDLARPSTNLLQHC